MKLLLLIVACVVLAVYADSIGAFTYSAEIIGIAPSGATDAGEDYTAAMLFGIVGLCAIVAAIGCRTVIVFGLAVIGGLAMLALAAAMLP